MSKTVLYIAMSLDGFIARPNGNLDWLTSTPKPVIGDYGYAALLESIGTTIMGRKTYDEVMVFGIEWPYAELNTYVITTNQNLKIQSPNTHLLADNVADFVRNLKSTSEKDIWLIGGGQLVTMFINNNLLDKMIISIIPKLIGEGIPLFAPKPNEMNWKLIDSQPFNTGVVNLTYEKHSG